MPNTIKILQPRRHSTLDTFNYEVILTLFFKRLK